VTRDIPRLVRGIRRARGLTQEQLAHALGVTFSTVNGWENGRHRPIPALVSALERLAHESGISEKDSTASARRRTGAPAARRQRSR
jgi:transcriptional regulator with XRE-family HTH domain